ncbi:hypothetical protein [Shimia sp. MMG029]|uniref:hypothetical protein n=1 Tax=Shimia sp. MMG029 TaxID=3021978 RepID=UPI0022FF13EA|nr:hypothetical protein [Shimia sp. MMG029]MDA5556060.1 hypothetical protein [Shimia sp. MMG029]
MLTPPTPPPQQRSIHVNWQDWLPYLEDSTASEAEKQQVIETIWSIAMAFVDLGWDIDTSENTSGQSFDLTAALRAAVLNSEGNNARSSSEAVAHKNKEAV